MNRDLHDTNSSAVLTALSETRRGSGSVALGMVLTLVIDATESEHYDALKAANAAAREHPCRIVCVIRRPGKSAPRLDAEIRVGGDNMLGEVLILRLYGLLREQADSIVLPMLLPDAPVLVWWPGDGPAVPSLDPLGLLAQRRVTDAASSTKPTESLRARALDHSPGDTDFAWTRITPWRTLLAAALDQPFDEITTGEVDAARNNASAELLAAWLEDRLDIEVTRRTTRGPGITGVRLMTKRGEITITRPDGRLASLVRTGQPDRAVPLPRRATDELLAEELRRLDPDDVYNETIKRLFGNTTASGRLAGGDAQAQQLTRRPAPARKSAAARASDVADTPSRGKKVPALKRAAKQAAAQQAPLPKATGKRATPKGPLPRAKTAAEKAALAKSSAAAARRTPARKAPAKKVAPAKKAARTRA
ncbi:MAG TPA: glucose-6-phosphate dehydrogenase assembly protein OpcA [Acidothermaceae bacterium]